MTAGAFAFWGLIPLYWKLLAHVPAPELLAHRITWALPCLAVLLIALPSGDALPGILRSPRMMAYLALTTLFITGNWFAFLWAMNTERVLDASLGYYINPLVSVLLGFVFLGERLRRVQALAVVLAAVGVAVLTTHHGLPWISLVLGFSFGFYGLIRKVADVPALPGLFVEIAFLTPLSVGYLVWLGGRGEGAFALSAPGVTLLLIATGAVTSFPLILFAEGIRSLRLATVGFLQFMTPTLHFLLATLVFREPFDVFHLAAFAFIWVALSLYTYDLRRRLRGPSRET